MKRLLLLILFLVMVVPVVAQDATAEAVEGPIVVNIESPAEESEPAVIDQSPVNDTVAIVVIVVLGTLLTGAGIYGAYITGWIAKLVPPETAASIFQAGFRFGIQAALNQAAGTVGTADDDFFLEMARARGLEVVKNADGSYTVNQPSGLNSSQSGFASTAAANLR